VNQATITLAAAYLSCNKVPLGEIANVLKIIDDAIGGIDLEVPRPAVSIEESIQDDFLVCLEDGKQVTLLKRYLKQAFGMTPEDYREKWNLPEDYPMVPKKYSEKRSGIAKEHGLGKVNQDGVDHL